MARRRYREKIHSARRCALTFGGCSRSWSLSGCRSLSSIPLGPRFSERIIFSATTSRRFTRRKSLAFHRIAGLGLNRIGGRTGSFSLPHFLSFGRQGDFVSPVTIIAARTTKRFGPTPRHAPSVSRGKATGANVPFHSLCRTHTAIFSTSRFFSFWF